MKTSRWLWMLGLLLLVASYAIAEDITLTTYYPSPRGVYDMLRTFRDVQIGDLNPPLGTPPRLKVRQADPAPAMQVEMPNSGRPSTIAFMIGDHGNVLINGNTVPATDPMLHVSGPVEADAFRAFQQSGRYAFVEAGSNFGHVKLGGFNLSPPAYVPMDLDGNPVHICGNSNCNTMVGSLVPAKNRLDVFGGMAIGAGAAGTLTAPANGLLVNGNVGLGVPAPTHRLEVIGGTQTDSL